MNKRIVLLIASGSALILGLVLTFGLWQVSGISRLHSLIDNIYAHPFTVENAALEARTTATRMRHRMLEIAQTGNRATLDRLAAETQPLERSLRASMGIVEAQFVGDLGKVKEITRQLDAWQSLRSRIIDLAKRGQAAEADKLAKTDGARVFAQVSDNMDYIIGFSKQNAAALASEADRRAAAQIGMALWMLPGLALAIVLTCWSLARRVSSIVAQEEHLLEELRLKALLLDNVSDSIFVHDFDGNFHYINEAAWKSRGYTLQELSGMSLRQLDAPEYAELIDIRARELTEKGFIVFDSAHLRKDGTVMPIEVSASLIESKGRQLVISTVRDITERRQAETALRENEEMFRKVTAAAQDAIIVMGADQRVLLWNAAAERIFGYSSAEAVGQDLHELITPVQARAAFARAYPRFQQSGDGAIICKVREVIALRKGGVEFPVELSVSSILLRGQWHAVGIVRDITERKRLEQALQRKNVMYSVLSATNSAIVRTQEPHALFDAICRAALDLGGFSLVFVGIVNETDMRVMPVVAKGKARSYLDKVVIHCREDLPTGRGPTGTAIAEQRHVVINDFLNDASTESWHDAAWRYGIRSSLSLPIQGGGLRGAIVMYAAERDYFDQDVIGLALEMAKDSSYALDKMHTEKLHRQDEARLQLHATMFANSSEAMLITDEDNNIIMVNQAFTALTGYTLEEVRGRNPRLLKSGKHEREFYLNLWESLLKHGFWQGEIWDRSKAGEVFPLWTTINLVRDGGGKTVNYLTVYSDLSQKKALEQLHHLQRHDALTGLPNRLLLEDRVTEAIAHAHLYNRYVAVLFVNLDHFHAINEMLGHAAGDEVLRIIAQRLAENVGGQATASHFSGDTFVVVAPDIEHSSEINLLAEVLLDVVAAPLPLQAQDIEITARIGIAVYPDDGKDFSELTKNADLAMIQAKQEGRNNYCYFTRAMDGSSRQMFAMRSELRHALKNNWFTLHYQPQVNILSGEITGCEALIRMRHPERGLVPPAEFIQVAEESGLIVPIGEWVMREACSQMKRWHDEGHDDLVVAVNVSPLQLRQPNLAAVIREALDDCGLAAQYLELEFTEGALIKNIASTLQFMKNLKAMGVRLAIDDFGTGYSSLNYLRQFTVDKLKIDQSFVQNIAHDPNDASIVQAVIALARSLGLSTIAEGVETEAQLGYLRSLHCNEIQGHYYGKAIPPDEFLNLLQTEPEVAGEQSPNTLLLVDDEENVLTSLKRILRREGYRILTATSAEEGLELLAKNNVRVVLSDQRMPGMGGVEFLRRVKLMYPDTVRMILSGYTDVDTMTDAINKGEIYQFITKPWEKENLIASLREAFLRYDTLKKNRL